MKKQLLFESISFVFGKKLFILTFFTLLSLLTAQSSFAQQWPILGNENQISAISSSYTSIAVLNDVPYVVFREATGPVVKVKKRNADGTWIQVGDDIGSNLNFTRIYLDKVNNLYVTYVDAGNGNKLAVKMYNNTTQIWEPLNGDSNNLYVSSGSVTYTVSQLTSTPRSSLAFDSDNKPYIAYGEGASLTPTVKKFDSTSWTALTGTSNPTGFAIGVSLVLDEADVPWLTYCNSTSATSTTGTMVLYQFTGGTWTAATTSPVTSGIRHTSMALNASGNLTIAFFNINDTNRATAIEYNKTTATWSSTTRIGSRDSPSLSLIRDISGNLYCSFIDNVASTATYSARVFKQAAGTTAWTELKDPAVTRGIDEPVGNLTIAAGSEHPFIVYTKTNSNSISTPIVRNYTPPAPPAVLTTKALTNITTTTAETGGSITSDGGSAITERGIVYSTNSTPTTANTKIIDAATGTGSFTLTLPNLSPATLYYIRAYAINGDGTTTSYGNTIRLNTLQIADAVVTTPKQMEYLNRGLIAVRKSTGEVHVGWRLLGNEPSNIAFNIYRNGVKINSNPITNSTNYTDFVTTNDTYTIRTVLNGTEGTPSESASVWTNNQLSVPLQIPPGGTTPDGKAYTYTANDASVGDVDGDGEYEIILKWEPTVANHNSGGYSGNQIFDCYKLNGTKLWRIDLGINMNGGPHFNPFMVYDFDGDGKAEIILKTADGTIDGTGAVIGNATVDYRNTSGWVQQGPEFLTVFNGLTGAAMASTTYQPARANTSDWGDNYGNRQDRFVSAVAYLDGARPSIVVGRGYYDKLVRAAYDWRNGQLTLRWIFDSKDPTDLANNALSSQGNHQMTVGDVDGDGKDEIINGSSAINDDGKRLWTYGQGHGDALHMSDMDPDRPGQEIWQCLESEGQYSPYGIRLLDAKNGQMLFGAVTTGDVGRALAADIDPSHRGYEMWSSSGNLYNVQDGQIGTSKPTGGSQAVNHAVWWDGDLGRELLDGAILDKWNPATQSLSRVFTIYNAAPVSSNNDTKKNPALTADIFGDWREEIILRRSDNTALIIFTTTTPTEHRIYTLMHDPQYRTAIAWQNSGYNQPPHPSFFLGYDMATPPVPNIKIKNITEIANNAPNAVTDQIAIAEGATSTTLVGGATSVLANDTDTENNALTATLVSNVTNGTLTLNSNGTFSYVHNGSETTSDSFSYKANDGISDSNVVTVSIAVNLVNDAPIATADVATVAEGGTANGITVLANDTDAENNPLTAVLVSNVTNGTLTLNSNETFSYVHNGSETTSDSFTYMANDGTSNSNIVTVTITVTPVNDAPVAVADAISVPNGATATVLVGNSTSILANDTDAENNTLTAVLVSNVANGTLTLNSNGTFSYVHNGSSTTSDSFTYRANDGTSNSNVVTVSITVTPVNHAPIATADVATVAEGGTVNGTTVLANDTDSDNNPLTAVLVSNVTNGTLTLNSNGTFSYVHNGSETTSDSFMYKAYDGVLYSNVVTVTITVTPVNDAPIALADAISVANGGTATALVGNSTSVLANDTDAENNTLTAVLVSNVANGTLTLNNNGAFSYVHNGSNTTSDSFTYKAYDGTSNSNVITVNIIIAPFTVANNNFTIESRSETCANKNNGEIIINALNSYNYVAKINGANYPFVNNSLTVSNLAPGAYTFCITIAGKTFEQCFNVNIAQGGTITGKATISSDKVAVEITEGTAPFEVLVNGISQFETNASSFTVDVKQGDLLEVKTAKACEGVYAKSIVGVFGNVVAYPNPTHGWVEISIPTTQKEVKIEVYATSGQLISKGNYTIVNEKTQLNLDKLSTGVYTAKVYLETPVNLTIIKQ